MIKVCPSCSNVDIERLESMVPTSQIEETCLGLCGANFDQAIAYVNGEWIEADDEEEVFKAVEKWLLDSK